MWRQDGYGHVDIGQELSGSGGGYAAIAAFQHMTRFANGMPFLETQDDPSPRSGNPPYFAWVAHPGGQNEGGSFVIHCCVRY
jgi:hypothetical protein